MDPVFKQAEKGKPAQFAFTPNSFIRPETRLTREKETIAARSPILFIGCIIRHYQPTQREVKSKRTPLLPSAIISDFCRHLAEATIGTDGGGGGGDSSVSVSSSFPGPN